MRHEKGPRRPSPAMVVAMAALFVALSGAAYAAVAKNSVGAKQIKTNAVRAAEIQDGAVGANEIPNGSLTGDDVQNDSLQSADVDGLGSSDVTDESLNGGDVGNGSLTGDDVADESLGGGDVADGSLAKGDLAPNSFLPTEIIARRADFNLPAGPGANLPGPEVDGFETCEPGETIIGGSVNTSSPAGATTLISRPATDTVGNGGIPQDNAFTAWKGTARTETNAAATMRVFAICAR